MKNIKLVLILLSIVALISCGGGSGTTGGTSGTTGGTSGTLPSTRPAGQITGSAFDSEIINGATTVYVWDGTKGKRLASSVTTAKGLYKNSIVSIDTPAMVEVTQGASGSYIEEVSGVRVTLSKTHFLRACFSYVSGTDYNVTVSFTTTISCGLAEYLISTGMDAESAISVANQRISGAFGFDITQVTPVNVTATASNSVTPTNKILYGMFSAAVSQWTYNLAIELGITPHTLIRSIDFIKLAYEDIAADGLLDGKGVGARQLSFSSKLINADVYRHGLAVAMMDFIRSAKNKTGLTNSLMYTYVQTYNDTSSVIFNIPPTIMLNENAPAYIANQYPKGTDIYKGTPTPKNLRGIITPTMDVYTTVGLQSASLYIDGILASTSQVSTSRNNALIFNDVDTSINSEMKHTFSFVIVDIMGGVYTKDIIVQYNNSVEKPVMGFLARSDNFQGSPYLKYTNPPATGAGGCYLYVTTNVTADSDKLNIKVNNNDLVYDGRVAGFTASKSGKPINGLNDLRDTYKGQTTQQCTGVYITGSDVAGNVVSVVNQLSAGGSLGYVGSVYFLSVQPLICGFSGRSCAQLGL